MGVGAVEEGRAGRSDIRGQHGIVESRTGVVGINVEVVVVIVGSARVQGDAEDDSRVGQGGTKRAREMGFEAGICQATMICQ